jgi:quinol monooxygenase YgiN
MIVRLTFCKFNPDSLNEVKAIYNRDIAPVARMKQGNLGIRFIEPVDKSDDFNSISELATQADVDLYENSGVYKTLVGKLADFLTKPAVLKTYTTEDVLEVH